MVDLLISFGVSLHSCTSVPISFGVLMQISLPETFDGSVVNLLQNPPQVSEHDTGYLYKKLIGSSAQIHTKKLEYQVELKLAMKNGVYKHFGMLWPHLQYGMLF